MTTTFEEELNTILASTKNAISRILLSQDRILQHKPYTWTTEDQEQHLLKAARHINTHIQIQNGYEEEDKENHLDNAICRLAMAITQGK